MDFAITFLLESFASAVKTDGVFDVSLEFVVVVIALLLYVGQSTQAIRFLTGGAHKSCKSSKGKYKAPSKVVNSEVLGFVAQVERGGISAREALQQYEDLVRKQRVDLSAHLVDEDVSTAFYSALIDCGVHRASRSGCDGPVAKATLAQLLADMRDFGFSRSQEFYARALKTIVGARLFDDAFWLHSVMVADGVPPNAVACGHLLSVAASINDAEKGLALMQELPTLCEIPPRNIMIALRVYVSAGNWQGASQMLRTLYKNGSALDALAINTVLSLCIDHCEVVAACELWEELRGRGADTISCNILLKGFTQTADVVQAEKLLAQMLESGPAPDTITFNTIIECTVRALQSQQVTNPEAGRRMTPVGVEGCQRPWQLLAIMQRQGLKADWYTTFSLVKGLRFIPRELNPIDAVLELARGVVAQSDGEVAGSQVGLRESVCQFLLEECANTGDIAHMMAVFMLMHSMNVKASVATYSVLIKSLGKVGKMSACHEVWRILTAEATPTLDAFRIYIEACVGNDDFTIAEEVMKAMSALGLKPDGPVYLSMIQVYSRRRQHGRVLELYTEMRNQGIPRAETVFRCILGIFSRDAAEAGVLEGILSDMYDSGVKLNSTTYSMLINAHCLAGSLGQAMALFRLMRSSRTQITTTTVIGILTATAKAGMVAEAEELLEYAKAAGITPSSQVMSTVSWMYSCPRA